MPKDEERETWRQADDPAETKSTLLQELAEWPDAVKGLIAGSDNIVKFGLYDRPELTPQHWYRGRCVLVGDAAHPTRSVEQRCAFY